MFTLYVLEGCPFCEMAMGLLGEIGIPYKHHIVTSENKHIYKKKHKMETFPQIFYQEKGGKKHTVGGFADLNSLMEACRIKKAHKVSKKQLEETIEFFSKFKSPEEFKYTMEIYKIMASRNIDIDLLEQSCRHYK